MAKILFLQNIWIEFYGVMQLSALLKKNGHEVDILFENDENTVSYIEETKPDLIAYSAMSIQWQWIKTLSSYLKEQGIKTPQIIGGIHSTMYPDITIAHPGIDILCIAEGEYAMLELCDAIDKGEDYSKIDSLWVKDGESITKNIMRPKLREEMLDSLPFADRQLYRKYKHFRDYPFAIFVGSRGCPFKCTFCEVPEINERYGGGKSTYYRGVERFIDEIQYVKDQGLLEGRLVMLTDSTFNSNKRWFMEFMRLYKERIDVPFSCNLRVDLVTEEQVKAMKEAGCDNVRFGVESGDEEIRNTVLNKKLTDEKLYSCAKYLRQYKIPYITFNLFGNPGETYEQAWSTVYANQKIQPSAMGAYVFVLFPGIAATNYALAKKMIDESDLVKLEKPPYNIHLSLLATHPDRNPDIIKICNLQKFAIVVTRYPFLEPVVRLLCKLPPLGIFGIFYSACQAWEWQKWSTRTTIKRIMFEALLNYQALITNNKSDGGIFGWISGILVKGKREEAKKPHTEKLPGVLESHHERKIVD